MDFHKRNDATSVNGNVVNGQRADIAQTVRGSDFYWAICSAMGAATLGFLVWSITKPRSHRLFHYITAGVTMVAFIAYYTMASNLGWTPIMVEFSRSDPKVAGTFREIFYVRYIDWFITTPLLLLDLLLTAGMPWPTILWVILMDWVMIITGLVGALVKTRYKWGYFAFGCAALFYIGYQLAWEARRHASSLGQDIGRVFFLCGSLTLVLWFLYPIAWGVCEGGNVISPDSEAVFYGILDFFAKPIFGLMLLFGHRNIDPVRLGMRIRDYDEDPSVHGGVRGEKSVAPNTAGDATVRNGTAGVTSSGVTNGHTDGHTNGAHNV